MFSQHSQTQEDDFEDLAPAAGTVQLGGALDLPDVLLEGVSDVIGRHQRQSRVRGAAASDVIRSSDVIVRCPGSRGGRGSVSAAVSRVQNPELVFLKTYMQ